MLSGHELFSRFERIRSYLPKNRFVRIRCSAYNFEANMQKTACLGSNKGTNRTERANKANGVDIQSRHPVKEYTNSSWMHINSNYMMFFYESYMSSTGWSYFLF